MVIFIIVSVEAVSFISFISLVSICSSGESPILPPFLPCTMTISQFYRNCQPVKQIVLLCS